MKVVKLISKHVFSGFKVFKVKYSNDQILNTKLHYVHQIV